MYRYLVAKWWKLQCQIYSLKITNLLKVKVVNQNCLENLYNGKNGKFGPFNLLDIGRFNNMGAIFSMPLKTDNFPIH